MFSKKEIVILYNGPLYGITSSACDYLYHLKRDAGQKQLKIFVQTWEVLDNELWIEAFKKKIDEFDNGVDYDIVVDQYNSPSAMKAYKTFNSAVGYKGTDVPHLLGKRVWYFYSLLQGLKRIKQYNKDAFVIRLDSDYSAFFDWDGKPMANLVEYLYKGTTRIFNILLHPKYFGSSANDIFFTFQAYPEGYSEKFFMSSIDILEKIFGSNFNINTFMLKYSKIYLEFFNKLDKKLDLNAPKMLERVFGSYDIVPNEGAYYLYRLINDHKKDIPVVEAGDIRSVFVPNTSITNPWPSIVDGKVELTVPLMKLKVFNDHLHKYLPEHTVYGKADRN